MSQVEPKSLPGEAPPPARSAIYHVFQALSFDSLPPTERHLAEFLLLLPLAALIICLYRNLIGVNSFGTFAPELIGMAFRDRSHDFVSASECKLDADVRVDFGERVQSILKEVTNEALATAYLYRASPETVQLP